MSESLLVHELYLSLQGESTFAGLPCVFIRLTGCNLRCSYCDTAYAFTGGEIWSFDRILHRLNELTLPYAQASLPDGSRLPLIEFTGGEPLLQKGSVLLMKILCDEGWTVLVETSGALEITRVDPRVRRIVDVKCPSSGESEKNLWSNLQALHPHDEVKFVIGTEADYSFACSVLTKHLLTSKCPVLFSWAHPLHSEQQDPALKRPPEGQQWLSRKDLAERIIADGLPVRFQVQMHKVIWHPEARGV